MKISIKQLRSLIKEAIDNDDEWTASRRSILTVTGDEASNTIRIVCNEVDLDEEVPLIEKMLDKIARRTGSSVEQNAPDMFELIIDPSNAREQLEVSLDEIGINLRDMFPGTLQVPVAGADFGFEVVTR